MKTVTFCKLCGNVVNAEFRYCPYCGNKRKVRDMDEIIDSSLSKVKPPVLPWRLVHLQKIEKKLEALEHELETIDKQNQ